MDSCTGASLQPAPYLRPGGVDRIRHIFVRFAHPAAPVNHFIILFLHNNICIQKSDPILFSTFRVGPDDPRRLLPGHQLDLGDTNHDARAVRNPRCHLARRTPVRLKFYSLL